MSSGEILGFDRRKVLAGLVLAAALSVGAAAAVGAAADYGKLARSFGHADAALLPLCLVGELAAYTGYVLAYPAVAAAAGGPRLRHRDAARVVTLGLGAYVVGSAAGSLGVDFWAMRKAGARLHEAARRTLALNTLQSGALMLLAALGGIVLLVQGVGGAALVMAAAWAGAVPAAAAAAALVSSERLASRLTSAPVGPERPTGRSPGPWATWAGAKLRKGFADTIGGVVFVRQVIEHPLRRLGGVAGYPLFWLGDFLVLWIALDAFGYRLSPPRLVVAEATAWTLSLLPLPAGGSGVAEASMSYTLHAVGVPLSSALSGALVYRAVNFWLPLLPALLLVPRVAPLRRRLERTEREERAPDEHPPEQ